MENNKAQLAARSSLNYQQIAFCENIQAGDNGKQAYLKAYPQSSELSAESSASDLLSQDKVKDYIYALKSITELVVEDSGISRDLITTCRRKIIQSSVSKDSDKLTACRDQAAMDGHNEPEKVEHGFKVVWGESSGT